MVKTKNGSGGLGRLLRRFVRHDAGNVLMLTAAMLIPLTALIGSGVDLGRTYVARERIQVACDAAALAGRRAVSAGVTDQTLIQNEAAKFFNYNFPKNSYGTADFTPSTTYDSSTKIVTVTASTTLPMSLMTIFGFATMPVSVTCNAQQNFVNTDVVLVLDVTGSMLCKPSQTSCSNTNETSSSKIVAMRSAVLALYDALSTAQSQLEAAGLRLRYGIVPYSSTVNIGNAVYGLNPGYIQSQPSYWQNVCTGSGQSKSCSNQFKPISSPHPASWFTNGSWGGCVEEAGTVSTITTSSGFSIPSGANDMNVDLVPTLGTSSAAMATQWAPFDPATEQGEEDSSSCTAAQAKPLQAWDNRNDLSTYLTSLKASGGTMSDEGLVWGGRMLSQTGIWAALNPAKFGNMPVNRFVILMTDGGITAYKSYYAAYGQEDLDHRVDGTPYPCAGNSTQAGAECVADSHIHRQRFAMICNEIKNGDTSIWGIGFGTSLSDPDDLSALQNCATNTGQFAYITDSASLTAKFTAIGQAIGALRLTQ
jgi:Flp pilus assembly protein TadG